MTTAEDYDKQCRDALQKNPDAHTAPLSSRPEVRPVFCPLAGIPSERFIARGVDLSLEKVRPLETNKESELSGWLPSLRESGMEASSPATSVGTYVCWFLT